MSLYCILGISRDADEESIRAAYRVLARRYHPDVGSGSSSEKFRAITEAYEILSDPERRRSYDRSLDNPLPAGVRVEHVTVEPMTAPPEPLAPNHFGRRRPLYLTALKPEP